MLPKGAACSYIMRTLMCVDFACCSHHPCSLHDDLYGTYDKAFRSCERFFPFTTYNTHDTQCYAGLVCPLLGGCCEENLFDTPFFSALSMEDSDLGKKGGGNTTVSSSIDSREIPRSPFVQYAPTRSTVFSENTVLLVAAYCRNNTKGEI